jgi:hypothetical protein
MKHFDDIVREKAALETIDLPGGFNERQNYLIKNLIINSSISDKRIRFHGIRYKTAVAFIIILILGSVTVAADQLTGGDFFAQFYTNTANSDKANEYNYMDIEQLEDMSSSTIGTVIDTDVITIEVLGVVMSGNTADVMIKVTAKELDSVLYDNGVPPLMNYRFENVDTSLFRNSSEMMSERYYYSDDDKSLATNQLIILYSFISTDTFDDEVYTMELDQFGYYSKDVHYVCVYDEAWKFDIKFDAKADKYKEVFVNKPYAIDDLDINFNSIKITPLACVLSFESNIDDLNSNEHSIFSDEISELIINLKDGTKLDKENFTYTSTAAEVERGGEVLYVATLDFTVPINVDDVTSITVFGNEYTLE